MSLICVPVTEMYQGQLAITKVWVYPKGSNVPQSAAGAQITLIIYGAPFSTAHWYALGYNDAWWQNAIEICTEARPTSFNPNIWQAPLAWVDGSAWWVWGVAPTVGVSPVGDNYFRKAFNLSVASECTFDIVCDSEFVMYIDEALINSSPVFFNIFSMQAEAHTAGGIAAGNVPDWLPLAYLTVPTEAGIIYEYNVQCVSGAAPYWYLVQQYEESAWLEATIGTPMYIRGDVGGGVSISKDQVTWLPMVIGGAVQGSVMIWVGDLSWNTDPSVIAGNYVFTGKSVNMRSNIFSYSQMLSAGAHIIAIKGTHSDGPSPNPAGLLATVRNSSGQVITHSDDSWKCLPYPHTAPT